MALNNENSEDKKHWFEVSDFTNQIQNSNIATVCTAVYM